MYTLKKSLGQHFLHDENIVRKIVEALKTCHFTQLLEVGPGGGALTRHLLALPVAFKAVEVDEEKVNYLKKQFPSLEGRLIHQSILDLDKPFDDSFAVVGNFPYNISTEILFKILEWQESISCMVGMFQKEVAQRVAAPHGSKIYGVTSVLVQAFFDVHYLFDVSEYSFQPPPRVKSGVIKLLRRRQPMPMQSKQSLFRLVKAAFGQRRKTLRNACKNLFLPEVLQQSIFSKRAEQLSVEDFAALTFQLKP